MPAYYLARLQREFPELATQVASGELSVFRASVQSGLRKEPAKRKWNASDYAKGEAAKGVSPNNDRKALPEKSSGAFRTNASPPHRLLRRAGRYAPL